MIEQRGQGEEGDMAEKMSWGNSVCPSRPGRVSSGFGNRWGASSQDQPCLSEIALAVAAQRWDSWGEAEEAAHRRLCLHSRQEISCVLITLFLFPKQEEPSLGDKRPASYPSPLFGPFSMLEAVNPTSPTNSLPDMVIRIASFSLGTLHLYLHLHALDMQLVCWPGVPLLSQSLLAPCLPFTHRHRCLWRKILRVISCHPIWASQAGVEFLADFLHSPLLVLLLTIAVCCLVFLANEVQLREWNKRHHFLKATHNVPSALLPSWCFQLGISVINGVRGFVVYLFLPLGTVPLCGFQPSLTKHSPPVYLVGSSSTILKAFYSMSHSPGQTPHLSYPFSEWKRSCDPFEQIPLAFHSWGLLSPRENIIDDLTFLHYLDPVIL